MLNYYEDILGQIYTVAIVQEMFHFELHLFYNIIMNEWAMRNEKKKKLWTDIPKDIIDFVFALIWFIFQKQFVEK